MHLRPTKYPFFYIRTKAQKTERKTTRLQTKCLLHQKLKQQKYNEKDY